MADREIPWIDHLEEMRRRILASLVFLSVMFAGGIAVHKQLIKILTWPLSGLSTPLYFTSPAEGFVVALKVALFFALFVSMPFILWQLWQFLKPALFEHERTGIFILFSAATLMFVIGSAFCYFLVLPVALNFLLGFGSAEFKPLLSVGHYSSFVGFMVLGFGIAFNFPLVIIGLAQAGIVTAQWLRHIRKFVVLGIIILAAVLTPSPDVISQLLLAAPLWVFFEITIVVTSIIEKKRALTLSSQTR